MTDVLRFHRPPPALTGDRLVLSLREVRGRCALDLRGSLDVESAGGLECMIDQIACSSCRSVDVDVGHLEEVDIAGLRLLKGLSSYVEARGAGS